MKAVLGSHVLSIATSISKSMSKLS